MGADSFKAARDLLIAHRTDHGGRTGREFRWPVLGEFNWALDWFDAELAQGATADQPALIIVGEGAATR